MTVPFEQAPAHVMGAGLERPAATTAVLHELDPDGDPVLLTRVRAGDTDAYAELFLRHRASALAFAHTLGGASRADDLVAEAFTKVLSALQRDLGPTVSFRSYLLATIRSLHINGIRNDARLSLVEDYETLPPERMTVHDDVAARFDSATIAKAFRRLPERWQAVLWYSTVEGLSNEEVGHHLGLKANAVGQLSYRAREGLRQAYLDEHLATATEERCREVLALLPAYVRGSVDKRKRSGIAEHLAGCARCAAAMADLDGVNRRLGALLIPVVLGAGMDRLGWPGVAGHLRHTLRQRFLASIGAKSVVATVATVVMGGAALGVPLGWYAASERDHHTARSGEQTQPLRVDGPYVIEPEGPPRTHPARRHVRAQAPPSGHDEAKPTSGFSDHAPGADPPAVVTTSPAPAPMASSAAPHRRWGHDKRHQRRHHHPGTHAQSDTHTETHIHTPTDVDIDSHHLGPGQPHDPGQTTPMSSENDVRIGPLGITRTGVGATVVVPLYDLLTRSTVSLTFTSLVAAPVAQSAGWTCTGTGPQFSTTTTLTCVYDGPSTQSASLRVSDVAAGQSQVTAAVTNPAGVIDPQPGNNTSTASFA